MQEQGHSIWQRLIRLADTLEAAPVFCGQIGAWLTIPLITIIMFDAITRKFLRMTDFAIETGLYHLMNSPKLQDAEWHLHTMLFFLALGYAYARNAHMRLDLLRHRFDTRQRVWIDCLGGIFLLLPFLAVFAYNGWIYVVASWISDEGSSATTGLPNRWAIKSFVVIGAGLTAMATAALLLRCFVYLAGPAALRDKAGLERLARRDSTAPNQDGAAL